jgi:hypothetical protein
VSTSRSGICLYTQHVLGRGFVLIESSEEARGEELGGEELNVLKGSNSGVTLSNWSERRLEGWEEGVSGGK